MKLSQEQIEAVVAWMEELEYDVSLDYVKQRFKDDFSKKVEYEYGYGYNSPWRKPVVEDKDNTDWMKMYPEDPLDAAQMAYNIEKTKKDVYSQLDKELDLKIIVPESEWTRKRKEDLRNEVLRYIYRGKQVPEEWIEELNKYSK